MTKLSIVIPIYNEAATVEDLLRRVWAQPVFDLEKEMLLVESSSTDGTREIVRNFVANQPNKSGTTVRLLEQDAPRGKGNAVRFGLKNVTGDIVMIQDGDLEYSVEDYPALLEPILDGRTDFVLGSRHLSGGWKIRKFEKNVFTAFLLNLGGMLFHGAFNILYGQRLTDPTTMYKIFRRKCLSGFELVSNRFDFDFELLAKLIRSGHRPFEVPVEYKSRNFKEGKKIRVFRDPLTWIWAIVRFRVQPLREAPTQPGTEGR